MGVALNYSSEEFRRRFCYDTVHAIHLTIYRLTKKKRKPKEALLTVFYVKTKEKKKTKNDIFFEFIYLPSSIRPTFHFSKLAPPCPTPPFCPPFLSQLYTFPKLPHFVPTRWYNEIFSKITKLKKKGKKIGEQIVPQQKKKKITKENWNFFQV